jgi:hypothetical protein
MQKSQWGSSVLGLKEIIILIPLPEGELAIEEEEEEEEVVVLVVVVVVVVGAPFLPPPPGCYCMSPTQILHQELFSSLLC